MARTTADDCLQFVNNRYELVLISSKRARQLTVGVAKPLVEEDEKNEKATVLSLREIGEGKINPDEISLLEEESKNEPTQIDFESILRGFNETDREREEEKVEEEQIQTKDEGE